MVLIRQTMLWLAPDGKVRSFLGDAITPPPPPPVGTPVARITKTSTLNLRVVVSSTTSTEGTAGATITSRAWEMGDGTLLSGLTADHTYAASGSYKIILTITDSLGASSTTVLQVAVTQPAPPVDQPPVAAFSISANGQVVTVDASASSDPDVGDTATLLYAWDFGDGGAASTITATHTYATSGAKTVKLTVTDTSGQSSTLSKSVTVNTPPNAAFTPVVSGLSVSVDGTASSDPNGGSISSYDWNWGDGSAHGAGATASHTYAGPGNYPIVLTVTDNQGAGDTANASVTVAVTGTFIYGTTKPDATNTGVGLAELGYSVPTIVYTGSLSPAGTVTIKDRIINGPITPTTGSTLNLENCIVQGNGTIAKRLLSGTNGGVTIVAKFCDIRGLGTQAQANDTGHDQDGIISDHADTTITTYRCHLYNLNDGWDPALGTISDFGSFLEKFRTTYDSTRGDHRNHNDGSQNAGTCKFTLTGTRVVATSDPTTSMTAAEATAIAAPTYLYAESAIMLTPQAAFGNALDITVDSCWLDGGLITINGRSWNTACKGVFKNNRFGRNHYFGGTANSASFKAGTYASNLTWTNNTYENDGSAVPVTPF